MSTSDKRKRIRIINLRAGEDYYIYPDKIMKTSSTNPKPTKIVPLKLGRGQGLIEAAKAMARKSPEELPEILPSRLNRGLGLIEAAKDIARKMGSTPNKEV